MSRNCYVPQENGMNDRNSGFSTFPVVRQADGVPSPDGKSLLIEAKTTGGETLRFALTLSDVQHFVAFLLISVGKISLEHSRGGLPPNVEEANIIPIPVTAVTIGEPEGDEGYLGIEVGQANLVFSVPISEFAPLGRSILTVSAQPKATEFN
jgi:hypothetical protein